MSSRPYLGHFADPHSKVVVSPGCELSIAEVVAVARGDGGGHFAKVQLGGDWAARCQRSADYVQSVVAATMGRSRDELVELVRQRVEVASSSGAEAAAARALIYGVTTGFGHFKSRPLDSVESASQLQRNILRSHATGVGPPFPTEVVRAMMLIRVRTFVDGHSGLRPQVVQLLVELLNRRVHPWVPEQGSVGSSGDLCPLAHLALALMGEGFAWRDDGGGSAGYEWTGSPDAIGRVDSSAQPLAQERHGLGPSTDSNGESAASRSNTGKSGAWDVRLDRRPMPRPAREVLLEVGLEDQLLCELYPKEGLALTNGTAATTAVAALAVYDAGIMYGTANLAAGLSLQALRGFTRAMDPKVHALRRNEGQAHAARQILRFANESALLNRSNDVQDAYSLRCAPAVHGAALNAITHVWSVIEAEVNAVTDNPLFFDATVDGPPCDGYAACIWDAYAAGNFHGEPVGMAADYLKIAVAELANISERRIQCLLDEHHNRGLPSNLWPDRTTAGLNTGLMITQYAAAALVSENKVLAHPASVDSIPTSSNVEDHVAMATIAARNARRIIDNTRNVLAIELLAALQALDIRVGERGCDAGALSPAARAVLQAVREGNRVYPPVPPLGHQDDVLWPSVAAIYARVASGDLLRTALVHA